MRPVSLREEHERDAHGHFDHPRDGPHESLRARGMSRRVGHGEAAEVVARAQAVDGFGDVEREWDGLAERSGSIFSTALWSKLWWKHHGGDGELLLHARHVRATACSRSSFRSTPGADASHGCSASSAMARATSSAPSCGEPEAAARVVRSTLDALDRIFFGEQLPGDEDWPGRLGGRLWRREASPSLDLPASWDEYLAARRQLPGSSCAARSLLGREGEVVTRLADATTSKTTSTRCSTLHRAGARRRPTSPTRPSIANSRATRSLAAGYACGCWSSTAARSRRGAASRSAPSAATRRAAIPPSSASRSDSCSWRTPSGRRSPREQGVPVRARGRGIPSPASQTRIPGWRLVLTRSAIGGTLVTGADVESRDTRLRRCRPGGLRSQTSGWSQRLCDELDLLLGHVREERKRDDSARDLVGDGQRTAPAELGVVREAVDRRVVHARLHPRRLEAIRASSRSTSAARTATAR